jgi:hypothetical protein
MIAGHITVIRIAPAHHYEAPVIRSCETRTRVVETAAADAALPFQLRGDLRSQEKRDKTHQRGDCQDRHLHRASCCGHLLLRVRVHVFLVRMHHSTSLLHDPCMKRSTGVLHQAVVYPGG